MEISFKGKRALVTGASQGIGRDIAIQLSKCGAEVIAIARNQELLDKLKSENPEIETITLDISDWNSTQETLKTVKNIDVLVNNAGLAILEPIINITEAHFDAVFNINVKAAMNMTQIVAKDMIARKKGGAIVNISSQASQAGLIDHGVYCASKGAIDAFTRVAALELGKHKIRVNCVNPTVIMTDMGKLGWSDPEKANPMLAKIPLGRFGQIREVSDAVLYLLSDKASMITGTCLPVDGGFLAT